MLSSTAPPSPLFTRGHPVFCCAPRGAGGATERGTPLDLGGLGFAFPVAVGAKLGRPEAPVIAVHGDGGFLMNSQEIETAVRHNIGVVTIVMNNNGWGSEKAYQKHYYGSRFIGCDIGNPLYDHRPRRVPDSGGRSPPPGLGRVGAAIDGASYS